MASQRLADIFGDLNKYSLDQENGEARFMEAALEATVKGTVIVYEGYRRDHQKVKVPVDFDAETGEIKTKDETRIIFDDCFQAVRPLEDFFISNPYQPDIQRQPFIIDRDITTDGEAKGQYGHFPNWKYVVAGSYAVSAEPTTFYRNKLMTDLASNQVEILRYFNRKENLHIITVNGVIMYNGPIPFKDGKYPYAKGIYEPFENSFFWGMGFPQKIMGEQDLQNTFINMMADKTFGSLLPYGLSSDLDDLIEDDVLQPNKIRKVGDINKWRFETLPGVNNAEQSMFQMVLNLARENAGDMGGSGGSTTPRGGKMTARQLLLKQQESMQRLGFSMNYLEDMERDRTTLRVNHTIQFWSIPKIEKITGKDGKEIEQMVYRDVRVDDAKLDNGQVGSRVIKLVGEEAKDPDKMAQIGDELSVYEAMGDELGNPTEAVAIRVDTFYDYNFSVQIVKNSTYEQNQALEQATRHEYSDWRLGLMAKFNFPVNVKELVAWVDESYSIDSDRFEAEPQPQPGQPGQEQPPQTPTGDVMNGASGVLTPGKVEMGSKQSGSLV